MREYYRTMFRDDLGAFMGDSQVPYFGHAWRYNCASQLDRVPAERRAEFLICLYFSVLVDQAMYSHFGQAYPSFSALTRYPKFCHGLSQFQHNPREILATPTDQGIVSAARVLAALPEGMDLFVDEVADFFDQHMPEIKPRAFFDALLEDPDVQIPLILTLGPAAENDVIIVAFVELHRAVQQLLGGAAG